MSAATKIAWSVRRIAIILAGLYILTAAALVSQQRRFIFFPNPNIGETPVAYGAAFEDVRIPVRDKNGSGELDAWWIPCPDPAAKVLVFFHGNAENVSANVEHAVRLNHYGFSVLLPDYRGYGRSSGGFPSESSVYTDAEATWRYLVEQRHIHPKDIVIYGHSLGGAVAVELASHHSDAAGLITESTFTSTVDVADRDSLFRMFPLRLIVTQRFDSIRKVPALKMPYLVVHGTGDQIIPYHMSERLFGAAPGPKRLLLVPRADHDDCAAVDPKGYEAAVRQFLQMRHPLATNY